MPIVEGSIRIHAPAAGPIRPVARLRPSSRLGSLRREMRFLDGAELAAAGVRVWVRAWTGLTMEVQYVGFQPPRSVAMKMIRGPWFFRQFAGTWLVPAARQRPDRSYLSLLVHDARTVVTVRDRPRDRVDVPAGCSGAACGV